ncbi:hypothetical protein LCGC14_2596890, partial [marine sediment metagenome]
EWMSPNREFELVLLATNPFYYDHLGGIVSGNTAPGPIPVGTATTRLTTELHGALSVPITVQLKDFRGNVVAALKYDAATAAGEWIELRHDLRLVRKFTAVGSSADARANLDATVSDHGFFFPAPDLCSRDVPAYPTVEVTAGSAVAVINKYRRAWL